MENLKPTNISSFYAPTGKSTKIADFVIAKKTVPTASIAASNTQGPELPKGGKKDNTWIYILASAVIIIGGICYINYKKQKDEEKQKQKN